LTANIDVGEGTRSDYLRDREREGSEFDTIVLDPPAFAKTRASLSGALRGYKEINLRAMRLLAPGGKLFTRELQFSSSEGAFPGDARGGRGR
jgi:23S rRNA (cytosine1962-C5)-methyltransferase